MKNAILFIVAIVVMLLGLALCNASKTQQSPNTQVAAAPAPAPAPEQRPVAPLTKQQKKEVAAFQAKLRRQFAEEQERNFLSNGFDFTVRTNGKDATTIRYTSVLVSRPLVYKLMNESDLANTLKTIGFKKAIFSDGYDAEWTYDLRK